jgi:hypothetical protein
MVVDGTASAGAEPPTPSGYQVSPDIDIDVVAQFGSAAAALVFTGQLAVVGRARTARFLISATAPADPPSWWVAVKINIDLGRELAAAAGGQPYVQTGGRLVLDHGWGPPPSGSTGIGARFDAGAAMQAGGSAGALVDVGRLRPVGVLDMVRTAGLQQQATGPLPDRAVVLLPGARAGGLIQRALELGLTVTYRPVRLDPLFDTAGGVPGVLTGGVTGGVTDDRGRVVTALDLRAGDGRLPASLLAALDRDPFTLACRAAAEPTTLLVQHGWSSPLPDVHLAALVDADVWVLADAAFGCWRLRGLAEPVDGASLARLADGYPLGEADPAWPPPDDGVEGIDGGFGGGVPEGPQVRVTPARTTGVAVDAAMLDDADLACLPTLLEGQPLADIAMLARGRDRHLLLAPGGLLEPLPIGEPLYCLGPGPLYLPLGYRLRPRLPTAARRALFGADAGIAVVALPEEALAFDLSSPVPVWTLWAGPPPRIDVQLPPTALDALVAVDALVTPQPAPEPAPEAGELGRTGQPPGGHGHGRHLLTRFGSRHTATGAGAGPRTWRDDAWDAERSGDLVRAAELHERHDDPLRAAHLYERAARTSRAGREPEPR